MNALPKNKKIFVGLSGGVDSSVVAKLLKDAGNEVIGVYIIPWQPPWVTCTWREDRRDAMRVAAQLGISFVSLDLSKEYEQEVASYMISEYKNCRTPNPDILCNEKIKFGGFYEWAMSKGADYVATGHYATIDKNTNLIVKAKDDSKDQSYFLWAVKKEQLPHLIFPLGTISKKKVRELAQKYNLVTAMRPDSQGICFLGPVDMQEFLEHYIPSRKGDVLDEQGEVIGSHDGAEFYTIGQRSGFDILKKGSDETAPYFVFSKNCEKNTLTVTTRFQVEQSDPKHITLTECNLFADSLNMYDEIKITYRYHGKEYDAEVLEYSKEKIIVKGEFPHDIALGQSVVLYAHNQMLAGGRVNHLQ